MSADFLFAFKNYNLIPHKFRIPRSRVTFNGQSQPDKSGVVATISRSAVCCCRFHFRSANLISCQAKRFNLLSILLFRFRCLWWRMVARQHASSRKSTPAAVHRQRHPTTMCRFWASARAVKSRWVWLYRIQLCLTNDINLFLIRWTTNVDRIRW